MGMNGSFRAATSAAVLTAFILTAAISGAATRQSKPASGAKQAKSMAEASKSKPAKKKAIKAKSVILLIGDGMGPVEVKAASVFLYGADRRMAMQKMPVQALVKTRSVDSDVTDSAAAATAMATGKKTNNGMVSMLPDGGGLGTILEVSRDAGKLTGLVATSSITHATPACFASHANSRATEYSIASQMLSNHVNVMLGGGKKFFLARTGEIFVNADILGDQEAKLLEVGGQVTATYWVTVEKTFTAPAGSINASVWAWRGEGEVDGFVDDLKLAEKGGKSGANLLVNPGFEQGGLKGWNDWKNTKVVPDGGSQAVEVGAKGGFEQKVRLVPGREYVVSFRARTADPYLKEERVDLWDLAAKEYTLLDKKEQLKGAKGSHVLGLFEPGPMENKPDEPSLEAMTSKAIQLLSQGPNGFFLVVEGSQIDWANHGNDPKYFLQQMASFDETVMAVREYAKTHPDVLVVVTADHETGGMALEGKPGNWEIKYSSKGHTGVDVPLFAQGPGSELFKSNWGIIDNTDIPANIGNAMGIPFP